VYIFEGEDSKTDKSPKDDVGLNCINQTPSTHFSVRCVPSQPSEKDDWRKVLLSIRLPKLEIIIVRLLWTMEVVLM